MPPVEFWVGFSEKLMVFESEFLNSTGFQIFIKMFLKILNAFKNKLTICEICLFYTNQKKKNNSNTHTICFLLLIIPGDTTIWDRSIVT